MLSQQAILEFQQIYKKRFGEEISFANAKNEAVRLLQIFELIYRPLRVKKNQYG